MDIPYHKSRQIQKLVALLRDREGGTHDLQELCSTLSDRASLEHYVEIVQLEILLEEASREFERESAHARRRRNSLSGQPRGPRRQVIVGTVASFVTACLVFGLFLSWLLAPSVTVPAVTVHNAFLKHAFTASLSASVGPGDPLPPGQLSLKSGAIVAEFSNGTEVIIEAPTRFEVLSGKSIRLYRGTVRAAVRNPGEQFTIKTDKLDVKDLGTEFGVKTGADGAVAASTFEGTIELLQPARGRTVVSHGEARHVNAEGHVADIPLDLSEFLDFIDVVDLAKAGALDPGHFRWLVNSLKLQDRSDLAVYFMFDEIARTSTEIRNCASKGVPNPGVLVNPRIGVGRWPSKQAFQFIADNKPDFICLDPADTPALEASGAFTMIIPFCLDEVPELGEECSLLGSGRAGWSLFLRGEVGGARVGLRAAPKSPTEPQLPSLLSQTVLHPGEWHHLSLLCSPAGDRQSLNLFIDQSLEASGVFQLASDGLPLWLGNSQFHSPAEFSGRIDEFFYFGRALPQPQLRAIVGQSHWKDGATSGSESLPSASSHSTRSLLR